MRKYYGRKSLKIKTEYQVNESSTKDKRKKFNEMIEEIKKSKNKVALVVETVDRLQRSFKETSILDDLRKKDKIEIHFLRENLVIHVNSNSSELARWDFAVLMARIYVTQLGDNVKRSIKERFEQGKILSRAPLGYLNITDVDGKKSVIIDEKITPYVKKLLKCMQRVRHQHCLNDAKM